MRIVFVASGAFALPTLRWLATSEDEVALVVTQPARAAGRGLRTTRTPVHALAEELNLPILESDNVNRPEEISRIGSLRADLAWVIAFGQKIGDEFRSMLPGGCLNLHASLLPRYRGAAPVHWAVIEGEERTGCTVFRVVDRMDAGPILTTRWTYIKDDETTGELHDRLAAIGVDAVQDAMSQFGGGHAPPGVPQDESQATRAPKLSKQDGWIRFDRPAAEVSQRIRGLTPWPGAAVRFHAAGGRWENVLLCRARRAENPAAPMIPPGTIDARRYVAALDGFVEPLEIKPSSGRLMTWPEYVNGRQVSAGDTFRPLCESETSRQAAR
jgi:methionyl-tRNA formyltransferase